ncbi:MAG: LytTR family DNA-binding domain-containing protein [Bacteroidota bacterium]
MFSFLKKPYPYNSFSLKEILTDFYIGCFVALFLIIFQPFDISLWQTEFKTLKLVGFGFVSFICPLVFRIISTQVLNAQKPEETWMVWKETLSLLLVLMFIAFGNLCYSNLIRISHFNIQELLLTSVATFLLAIFPITANVVLKYNRFITLNKKDAELMETEILKFQHRSEVNTGEENATQNQKTLLLIAENEKDSLELKPEELLYIESADNYSNVVFIKDKYVTKQLIRSSLKRLESQITFPFILRCHRSYIVNLKQVNHIKGNAQGYRISFKTGSDDTIPVSRNYSKALFERLETLK